MIVGITWSPDICLSFEAHTNCSFKVTLLAAIPHYFEIIPECRLPSHTKWAVNGAIILSISHYVQLEGIGRAFCQ